MRGKYLSIDDPFATTPADDEAQTVLVEEPAPAAVESAPIPAAVAAAGDSEKVRITIKSGAGYDVPWLTADFPSIDVAHAKLTEASRQKKLVEIFDVTARASAKFQELVGGNAPAPAGGDNKPAQSRAPQGAKEPPAWAPEKPYDDFVYKTGVSKSSGKTWHAWMPPQQGDSREAKFFYPPR